MKSGKIKVVIDSDIPFIKGVLEPWCLVEYRKGSEIVSRIIADADALIVRTRTRCDAKLLSGSNVRAIFTATIGSDHIDLDFCNNNGIMVFNAEGCNSGGVVQYVVTSIFAVLMKNGERIADKTIGIIGAGNVGERLAVFMEKIGVNVLRCDPPKSKINTSIKYHSLDHILLNSDIVTLHVPLDSSTHGMCSHSFFSKMKNGSILINTSRGEVMDEGALLMHRDKLGAVIIDVWQGEPLINRNLLEASDIATPHIAGYSYEGKVNATVISVKNFANFFGIEQLISYNIEIEKAPLNIRDFEKGEEKFKRVTELLLDRFPLIEEDTKLRANPVDFENIRSGYIFRREFPENFANYLATVLF